MNYFIRTIGFVAMVLLGTVSIWTTYVSLHDSILPEPELPIALPGGIVWNCSIVALGLSVAIGLMLFALKAAVINGEKRLGILGILGMTVVAFISITFNMDVLYRTADREFFVRYSNERMRATYEEYLARIQGVLSEKRTELLRELAKQEGELDAEVRGLRKAPAGYGQYARQEDYKLTLLQKTTEVEILNVEEAQKAKTQADELLRSSAPSSIAEIDQLQGQLRVACKDLAGVSGISMPEVVRLESPLFAVFAKLFDLKTVGLKEIFFLIVAFFLDLGDIIGYTLVPNRKKPRFALETPPGDNIYALQGPERVPERPPMLEAPQPWDDKDWPLPEASRQESSERLSSQAAAAPPPRHAHAFRIRRH